MLAPPELLDQLRALARPGAGPAAVPLSAEYTGEVVGGVAEIDAQFQVICFTDEATTVALPLDGKLCRSPKNPDAGEVQVGGKAVKADGAAGAAGRRRRADPRRPARRVRRAGEVDLHFRTPVAGADEERNVQFTAPRLPQSRLVLAFAQGIGLHPGAGPTRGAEFG